MSDFQELERQFGRWKAELLRLCTKIPDVISKASDAVRVGGKSFSELLQAIQSRVNNHRSQSNPHNLTAAQLDAYTKPEVDALIEQKQSRLGLAVSKLELSGSYNQSTQLLTINASRVIIDGYPVEIPTTTRTLAGVDVQYLKFTVARNQNRPTGGSFSTSTDSAESRDVFVVAVINRSGSNYVPTFLRTVRFGAYRISQQVQGKSIPATTGNPPSATSLPSNWFGG